MSRFKKLILAVAAVALAALPAVGLSQAVNLFGLEVQPFNAEPLATTITAADVDPVLVIKYVGSSANPTVANTTNTNIVFQVGGAAYTGFECPVVDAAGGIIDVTHANCNTLGKVVDAINSDTNRDFVAYIAAGLRTDSSADLLTDAADSDVSSPGGEVIYDDTSVNDDNTIVLSNVNVTGGKEWFGDRPAGLTRNPFDGFDTVLLYGIETFTNAGTLSTYDIYCVSESYKYSGGSETATLMYTEAAAATTVTGLLNEFVNSGGLRCRDGKVLLRVVASDADSSAIFMHAYGYRYRRAKN